VYLPKKMISKLFLVLIFLLLNLYSVAQHACGFKVSGGVSKLSERPAMTHENINIFYHFAPSGQAGLFYELGFAKNSIFGAELLFTQMACKQIVEISNPDRRGFVAPTYTLTQNIQISYLSLPVYYGLKINKVTLAVGFQTSLHLYNRIKTHHESVDPSYTFVADSESEADISDFDFGPKAGLQYNFSQRFSAEAGYYYGVSDILSGGGWYLQQITAGLRYKFWIKDKRER
jgi:opacity protein-like surface antigen